MTTICTTLPDSFMYVIVFGAVAAVVSVIMTMTGMSCPFLSNLWQNRIHNNNNHLLGLIAENMDRAMPTFTVSHV